MPDLPVRPHTPVTIQTVSKISPFHFQNFIFQFVDLSNQSGGFHRHDLQHCAAGHDIKPDLPHMLRSCDGRGNSGRDDEKCADAADNGGNADQREKAGGTAAVNGTLDRLVQSIPCRGKAADHQAEEQQDGASASPVQDAGMAADRIADKTQQRKKHQRCDRRYGVSEIEFHFSYTSCPADYNRDSQRTAPQPAVSKLLRTALHIHCSFCRITGDWINSFASSSCTMKYSMMRARSSR